MNRDELLAALEEKYPKHWFRTSEEFNGAKGGIWTSAEDKEQLHSGLPLFDYYSQDDGGGSSYSLGVNIHLVKWLDKKGWYCEFNDPGTVMIWKV